LNHQALPETEMLRRADEFAAEMARRRSVRDFSARPVAREVIAACLSAAVTAPSGANQQPWHFVAVGDPAVKRRIREAAEQEEREFYGGRAPDAWLETLAPLGTDARKPFLETAPWLIAVFQQRHGVGEHGERIQYYYPLESVGLATGVLITALHRAGLVALTHTPSPMKFLNDILGRPTAEKPFLLLVAGYPASGCRVPDIRRKPLRQTVSWFEERVE
jgi:nitroreductase